MTPRKLHSMKLKVNPNCTLCFTGTVSTFYHMILECPGVANFWKTVQENLSTIMHIPVPLSASVLISNDLSQLRLQKKNKKQKCVFLAGLTAAGWKPPHMLTQRQWVLTFIDVVYLELSPARIHGEKRK